MLRTLSDFLKWIFGKSNLRKGFLFRREKKMYFQTTKHKKHTPISQGKTKPQSNHKVKFLAINLTKIVKWELIFIIFQWTLENQI